MQTEVRLILVYLVRLVFMALAGWIALFPDSLPGAHVITRGGLAALLLVFSVLVGEVDRLRTQFEMLMRALKAATSKATEGAPTSDAVDILIRALGSRDAETRDKAHRNLVRITGQDLPPERDAWEAWRRSAGGSEEHAARP